MQSFGGHGLISAQCPLEPLKQPAAQDYENRYTNEVSQDLQKKSLGALVQTPQAVGHVESNPLFCPICIRRL